MPCLPIAAGCVLLADAGVVPGDGRPAVWIDWPEGAARSGGWLAAVPAGAVEVGSAVPAAESLGGMQVVVEAGLRDAVAASRDARQDAADASPAGTVAWLDAPDGRRDDPVEQRDGLDVRRDDRDARRGDPAGCREDLSRDDPDDRQAGQVECPAGQAARLYRDGRDARPEDECQADPDERRGDDPDHPDATHREAA